MSTQTEQIILPPDLAGWTASIIRGQSMLVITVDGETYRTRQRQRIEDAIEDARFLARNCGLIAHIEQLELAL
jgi:hypothetical protein